MSDDGFNSILDLAPPASSPGRASGVEFVEDSRLLALINDHLEACGFRQVKAFFDRSVLTLEGHVDSLYERQLAIYYVRKLTRLAGISDRICVRQAPRRIPRSERFRELLDQLKSAIAEWWMQNSKAAIGIVIALAIVACALLRDGETADPRVATVPFSGTLLVNGDVPSGTQVILHPEGHRLPEGAAAMGTVREDGSFDIGIYGTGSGVPPGSYVVTLHWVALRGEAPVRNRNPIPPKYASVETSPLKVVAEEAGRALPVIEIAGP